MLVLHLVVQGTGDPQLDGPVGLDSLGVSPCVRLDALECARSRGLLKLGVPFRNARLAEPAVSHGRRAPKRPLGPLDVPGGGERRAEECLDA
jgi:hypothetical protein